MDILPSPYVLELHPLWRHGHLADDGLFHLLPVDDAKLVNKLLCPGAYDLCQPLTIGLWVKEVHANK